VIATLATALAVIGSSRAEALPHGFFGMVVAGQPSADALQRMAGAGVGSVRLSVNWESVEPTRGAREWSFYDSEIGDIAAAGITSFPLLYGVPRWVSSHPAHPPVYTAAERDAWSSFVTDFASRYGPDGVFWRDHPDLPYEPLTSWEVWNEPNLNGFWDGQPNPKAYLRLLKTSAGALRAADPQAEVVLAGTFPHPPPHFGISVERFLNQLYRLPGARGAFDALAVHPYARRPNNVLSISRRIRALMNRHHDKRTPMLITELGWTTGGKGWATSPYRATEQTQARYLTSAYKLLIRRRHQLGLQSVFWHVWQDISGPGLLGSWLYKMGLLREDGTAKPALDAYARLAH
jgi:hypothetical protein